MLQSVSRRTRATLVYPIIPKLLKFPCLIQPGSAANGAFVWSGTRSLSRILVSPHSDVYYPLRIRDWCANEQTPRYADVSQALMKLTGADVFSVALLGD